MIGELRARTRFSAPLWVVDPALAASVKVAGATVVVNDGMSTGRDAGVG